MERHLMAPVVIPAVQRAISTAEGAGRVTGPGQLVTVFDRAQQGDDVQIRPGEVARPPCSRLPGKPGLKRPASPATQTH